MMPNDKPRSTDLPPGYDEEDPYEGEDLSNYPAWWRRNIDEFKEFGLRPYRPPLFSDGVNSTNKIKEIESDLNINIVIRAKNPTPESDWNVVINDDVVATIERYRDGDGRSVYVLTSLEFEELCRRAIK